jgi:hypothetical protein
MSNAIHEHEHESLGEYEGEFEYELLGELEGEGEGELHELHEHEHEHEHEGEHEAEQFFGALASLAGRALRSPALRKIAVKAAKAALSGAGSGLGDVLLGSDKELEGEGEFESHEHEHEHEGEGELNPIRRVYPDAMLEHMAHMASMAQSEQEAAEHMLPLIPIVASKLAPLVARVAPRVGARGVQLVTRIAPRIVTNVMKLAPNLTRGVGQITRVLHRNPATRPLLRVIPTIARRATAQIARQIARGRPMTPGGAVRILAQQTARTLCRPGECVHAYRRGRALDRRLHRAMPGVVGPVHRQWPRPGFRGQPSRRRAKYGYAPSGRRVATGVGYSPPVATYAQPVAQPAVYAAPGVAYAAPAAAPVYAAPTVGRAGRCVSVRVCPTCGR